MARALIDVPKSPRRGEIIEIRTLIAHPMETGYRAGSDGQKLPRDIIRRFNGHPVKDALALRSRVAEASIGSRIELVIVRNGQEQKLIGEIAEAPKRVMPSTAPPR